MSIAFPTSPTVNQTYRHPSSNKTFKWDGVKWTRVVIRLDTTPLLPASGGTLTGNLFVGGPSGNSDTATKAYVDAISAPKITQPQMDARVGPIGDPHFLYVSGNRTVRGQFTAAGDVTIKHPSAASYTSPNLSFQSTWTTMWVHGHHAPGIYAGLDFGHGGTFAMSVRYAPSLAVWTSGPRQVSSDIRAKKNIKHITDGISKIKNIKAYKYNFKPVEDEKTQTTIGVIAQHIQEAFPVAVSEAVVKEGDSPKLGVNTGALAALTLSVIKEIDAKLTEIEESQKV